MILSGLVAFKKPRTLANIFLAILVFFYALIAINIVVVNVMKDNDLLHIFRYMQLEMIYGIGPALYFYTKCITQPKFEFSKKDFLHFIPLLLEFIFYRTSIYRTGSDGLYLDVMPTNSYIYLTQQWLGVISIWTYSIASLIILKKYHKQIKESVLIIIRPSGAIAKARGGGLHARFLGYIGEGAIAIVTV